MPSTLAAEGTAIDTRLRIEDVYRSASIGGWTELWRLAGIETSAPGADADLFFVTLAESETHYSPATVYADRAITDDDLFQWESQSIASAASGQRYTSGRSTVHLLVRESRRADRDLGAPPYLYAGTMTYESHSGDRPMRILWQLHHALPADVCATARTIAA
ncbi:DUF3427 domain-containing protein [Micromonospora sp. NPDC048935]|uniref:DUF3427 domain-containing protein n=1 Tax=Micromonospora sp. NPDC048935 TaxID=3364262 RepID=UPI00370F8DA9